MMRCLVLAGILAIFVFSGPVMAEGPEALNPESVETIGVRIVQSGTLDVQGYIESAELKLYIPQEGTEEIRASPESWEYGEDGFGNRMAVFKWDKPSGIMDYRIETLVQGRAKHLKKERPPALGEGFLNETGTIVISPDISRTAYPYEKTLGGLAGLAIWVHDYIEYDKGLAGQLKPSDWVLENRRGVCAEYATLFISLARSKGIPARHVSGFAYSEMDGGFAEHAWAEIPVIGDNGVEWVGFDPTWLEAGYLDGTHIKLGVFPDGNHSEELTYKGRGLISWTKGENSFEMLEYSSRNITGISATGGNYSLLGSGLAEASLNAGECLISTVTASSCVDSEDREMLGIHDPVRNVWLCGGEKLYWAFDVSGGLDRDFIYTCPVVVYDQAGSRSRADVWISGTETPQSVSISGPDTVELGRGFTLEAGAHGDFVFFSSNLTERGGKAWDLNLNKPGTYRFYLYSGGALAVKEVEVVERKEFEIGLECPENVSLGGSFLLNATVKNLLNETGPGKLRVDFSGQTLERDIVLGPLEEGSFTFNLTAGGRPGMQRISASVLAKSLTGHSSSILVYEEERPRGILEAIIEAILGFFQAIIGFFEGLFGQG